ncbi:MAG: sulfatase-like hydrolase/transferase [Halobacteriaceae archaeon]
MPTADRPNVLFLFSDQHNYRCTGYHDGAAPEPVDTPTLDGLAASGTTFERAYCPMPLCTPSRLCTLTGRNVPGAGAWSNGDMLRDELPTMPESFAAAGYDTGLVGKMHLGGDNQFVGFQDRPYGDLLGRNGHQYEPVSPERRFSDGPRNEDAGLTEYPESQLQEATVIRESMAWLRERRAAADDRPWFLTASVSRPHPPFTVPPRHLDSYWPDGVTEPRVPGEDPPDDVTMKARAAYLGCVDYLDELLGEFLAMLDHGGFLENTIVVYATDHGEMMGEHGGWGKGRWREDSARVPLLFELPAHRDGDGGATIDTPVSLIDLYPTLCGLAGVDYPEDLDGTDLSRAVRESVEPDRDPVFVDSLGGGDGDYRAVVGDAFKYVHTRTGEDHLVHPAGDPFEREDFLDDGGVVEDAPAGAADAAAVLGERARGSLDWDAVDRRRERHRDLADGRGLAVSQGTAGNAYRLRDGRVVDGEATVTKPDVLAGDADGVFADFPGHRQGGDGDA